MKTPSPIWLNELRPYVAGKPTDELAREMGITHSVKLASNENPNGPSPKAVAAMRLAIEEVNRYPDAATYGLRQALSERLDVPMSQLLIGNGSNELISHLVRTFCTPDDHAVISDWAFIAYRLVLGAVGVPTTRVPMRDFRHDLPAMAAACGEKTRLLFVANPNNPTGTHNTPAELEELLETVPEHVLVVLDEAYVEYITAADYCSALSLRSKRANLVVMRTFSKAYGLAGTRVGYAVAPDYVTDLCNRVREPFNCNRVAQAGAIAALGDADFIAQSVRTNSEQMVVVTEGLRQRGLEVIDSQGNFVLARFPGLAGPELYDRLLRQGVIVRPMQPYGLTEHVRISIGLPAENQRLLSALHHCL